MHPVLLKLGPLVIHAYGFFLALGFGAGMFVAAREARRTGLDPEKIMDLAFWALLAAIIGARVPFVAFNWDMFKDRPVEVFYLWRGGLVFYGGFVGAGLVFLWMIRRNGMSFLKVADLFCLGLPLGYSFGRIGCFLAGCCYGQECHLPWAVTFGNPEGLAPLGVPLHPTQLYSFAASLILFFFLYFYLRPRKAWDGQILVYYLFLYAACRFTIEFFRGDDRGQFLLDLLSPSQALGLVMMALAGVLFFVLRGKIPAGKVSPK